MYSRFQILGEFGKEVLYLKKRMGFIKLALRNGIPVVPVYVFGANDTFRTSTFLRKTRLALVKRLRYKRSTSRCSRLVLCHVANDHQKDTMDHDVSFL